MPSAPTILARQRVAQSTLFSVEQLELEFSNGTRRTYERLITSGGPPAVMMVPITSDDNLLLIREYSAGTNSYQLSLPKGAVDEAESSEDAVHRELREEVGVDARKLQHLKRMTLAPGYMQYTIDCYLCWDLYPASLEGDEPEPLEVVAWPIAELEELFARDDFTEGRAIAAIYLALQAQQRLRLSSSSSEERA